MMARVLIPLPARDFDPSEAAVSWRVLVRAGHTVSFATPDGRAAVADDMMLTGKGLDFWGAIPFLRNLPLVGLLMRANRDAREAYADMISAMCRNPIPIIAGRPQAWSAIRSTMRRRPSWPGIAITFWRDGRAMPTPSRRPLRVC